MLLRRLGRSVGYLLAAFSVCACGAEHARDVKDSAVDGISPGSSASAGQDGGQARASGDLASADGSQTRTFQAIGLAACQTAAPSQLFAAPACSSAPLDCDAALEARLDQLLDACSYELNELAIEVFFDEGCVVGLTEGRDDPSITTEARRCLSEAIKTLRASCSQAVCIRVEHSTLAAL